MSKPTEWAEGLSLSAGGRKLVGKAGIVPVRRLADKTGLTDALSSALVRRDFHPVHDQGGVLVSAACAVLLGVRSVVGNRGDAAGGAGVAGAGNGTSVVAPAPDPTSRWTDPVQAVAPCGAVRLPPCRSGPARRRRRCPAPSNRSAACHPRLSTGSRPGAGRATRAVMEASGRTAALLRRSPLRIGRARFPGTTAQASPEGDGVLRRCHRWCPAVSARFRRRQCAWRSR